MLTKSDFKDIVIRKSRFVAKTQSLLNKIIKIILFFIMSLFYNIGVNISF